MKNGGEEPKFCEVAASGHVSVIRHASFAIWPLEKKSGSGAHGRAFRVWYSLWRDVRPSLMAPGVRHSGSGAHGRAFRVWYSLWRSFCAPPVAVAPSTDHTPSPCCPVEPQHGRFRVDTRGFPQPAVGPRHLRLDPREPPACRTPSGTWEPNPHREVTAAQPVPGPEPVPAWAMGWIMREGFCGGGWKTLRRFKNSTPEQAVMMAAWPEFIHTQCRASSGHAIGDAAKRLTPWPEANKSRPSRWRGAQDMYRAVTRSIEVSVEPFYIADRSDPAESRYVWAYRVTIDNQSDESVQAAVALLAHHRRHGAGRGGARRGRGRRAAGTQPRRQLPVHVGLPAFDAVGHHGRALHDAQRARARSSTSTSRPFRSTCRASRGR